MRLFYQLSLHCELAWPVKAVLKNDTSRIIRPQKIASAAAAALDNACSERYACLVLPKRQTHEKRPWKGPSRLSNAVIIDELNVSATLQVHSKVVYELPFPVLLQ